VFDHITLRVADLAAASRAFAAVLDALEIEQTASTPTFSVWGNFALTQTDEEHPIARSVQVAFIAPTAAHVDRFARAGVEAGFAGNGPAGLRTDYAEDYYAAFLKDDAGNCFGAVHRHGERAEGNIDHVAIRVGDVAAATVFYSTIGPAVGVTLSRQTSDRAEFSVGESDGTFSVIAGEPTQNTHLAFAGEDDDVTSRARNAWPVRRRWRPRAPRPRPRLLFVGHGAPAGRGSAGDAGTIQAFTHGLGVTTETRSDLPRRTSRLIEHDGSPLFLGADLLRREACLKPAAASAASQEPNRARTATGLGSRCGCASRRASLPSWPRNRHMPR
jgi:catechol 2,3-dioxygenase-like lactoylglutathione lyase family enzyme